MAPSAGDVGWIVDRGQAGEISAAHRLCRNGQGLRKGFARPLSLITQKEESLIFYDRTTQGPAKLVLTERRNWRGCGVEKILRIEHVIADELKQAPVKGVRSRSANDVDHRSGLAAEFRRVRSLLDIKFLRGIDGGSDHHVIEMFVGYRHSIEQIQVVAAALAQDIDQVSGLLHRIASCASRRPDHALAQHGQVEELPSLQGQIGHLLLRDHVPDFGGFQLHISNIRLNR